MKQKLKSLVRKSGLRWPKRQSLLATYVHYLAEFEAQRSSKGAPLRMRKWYLRLMGIPHGEHLSIGPDFYLQKRGYLKFGNRVDIGGDCRIMNFSQIEIGDDLLAAEGLYITSASHDPVTLSCIAQPVKIGKRVWTGTRVTILGGVTIGDDVVIGAGSVVTKDIPSNSIAVGIPAKIVKPLNRPEGQELWNTFPKEALDLYVSGLDTTA